MLLPLHRLNIKIRKGRQIAGRKGRDEILLTVRLLHQLVEAVSEFAYFLLGCVLGRGQKIRSVAGKLLHVLLLLFTVEHLPTLDAEHFAVRFELDGIQFAHEIDPFFGVSLDHALFPAPVFFVLI